MTVVRPVGGPAMVPSCNRVAAIVGGKAMTVCPCWNRTRSARISSALMYRSCGILAIACITMASKAGGMAGSNWRGIGGISRTCLYATASGFSPTKGGRPVTISYSTAPRE